MNGSHAICSTAPKDTVSKAKLKQTLMEMRVNADATDSEQRFLYIAGRNMVIDNLLVQLACGDLD